MTHAVCWLFSADLQYSFHSCEDFSLNLEFSILWEDREYVTIIIVTYNMQQAVRVSDFTEQY